MTDIFIAPHKKYCERCGRLIPNNGPLVDERGNVLTDEKGHMIMHKNPRLVCECWSEVKVPVAPKKPRRKKGAPKDPNQTGFNMQPGEKIR